MPLTFDDPEIPDMPLTFDDPEIPEKHILKFRSYHL